MIQLAIDVDALRAHRGFQDRQAGFTETFLQPRLGGAETIAVLSRPIEGGSDLGFVICPSLDGEELFLSDLEVMVARGLASAGFPVLRYATRGYGDSREESHEGIDLETYLTDATDAVSLMHSQEGIDRVGTLGALFGGTIAAVVASRLGLDRFILVEPKNNGRSYMREYLRSQILYQWGEATAAEGAVNQTSPLTRIKDEMKRTGWVDVKGFTLTRDVHDQISGLFLERSLEASGGSCLLIAVSRTGRPKPELTSLAQRLEQQGVTVQTSGVRTGGTPPLGRHHWRREGHESGKVDAHYEIKQEITSESIAWLRRVEGGSSGATEVGA